MISFFPFPFPVETPLGQGYAIYVTPAPMHENDCWTVVLDDKRILHFSTNQLRGVPNGTYDVAPPMPTSERQSGTLYPIMAETLLDLLETCQWEEAIAFVKDLHPDRAKAPKQTAPARPSSIRIEAASRSAIHLRSAAGNPECGAPGSPTLCSDPLWVTCRACGGSD